MKRTCIIGASPNPSRYSYSATKLLMDHGHEVIPVSIKKGMVEGQTILDIRDKPKIDDIDTLTLYINRYNQVEWHDYLLALKPKRIIFNPGAENQELNKLARANGIETLEACTLVMLHAGLY